MQPPTKVRRVEELSEVNNLKIVKTSDTDTETKATLDQEQKIYYAFYTGNESNSIMCKVGSVDLALLVDSGAEVNLISQKAFKVERNKREVFTEGQQ